MYAVKQQQKLDRCDPINIQFYFKKGRRDMQSANHRKALQFEQKRA